MRIVQSKLALEKHNGAVDHRSVKAEQQPADSRNSRGQVEVTGSALLSFRHGIVNSASDCQQPLLQENQPGRAGHPTVADQGLKYDRNLASQQNPGAVRYLVANRSE